MGVDIPEGAEFAPEPPTFHLLISKMVSICPGRRHGWFESNLGLIRKPFGFLVPINQADALALTRAAIAREYANANRK